MAMLLSLLQAHTVSAAANQEQGKARGKRLLHRLTVFVPKHRLVEVLSGFRHMGCPCPCFVAKDKWLLGWISPTSLSTVHGSKLS